MDHSKQWHFVPTDFKQGDLVSGGDIYGTVQENDLMSHNIMVPPRASGKIVQIASEGDYTLDDTTLVLENPQTGEKTEGSIYVIGVLIHCKVEFSGHRLQTTHSERRVSHFDGQVTINFLNSEI